MLSYWYMISYMLIMNMPLWITVYLRNKWCLNLESWIKASSCPTESSRSCCAVLVDSKITGCHCHARNFVHSKLLEGYFIFTRHLHDTYKIHFLEWADTPKDSAVFARVISSGRPSIHLAPCWGEISEYTTTYISVGTFCLRALVSFLTQFYEPTTYFWVISFGQDFVCFYKTPPYPHPPNFYRLV